MTWYNTGTVSVTNGSPTVNGTGTAWTDYVDAGQGFKGPDGKLYEILTVNSATQLTLNENYSGTTASGQGYKIAPLQGYIRDLALSASNLLLSFSSVRDNAGQGMFSDGSVGTPGVRFANDQDTGFYRPGTNTIAWVTNGTERVRVDASGNVGIGTTGPVGRLDLSNVSRVRWQLTDAIVREISTNAAANAYATRLFDASEYVFMGGGSEWARLTGGNFGIGTSTPGRRLDVQGDVVFRNTATFSGMSLVNTASTASSISTSFIDAANQNGVADSHLFFRHGTDGSSEVEFGITPPGAKTSDRRIIGMIMAPTVLAPGADNAFQLGWSARRWSVVYSATGSINTSDARYKQDITPIPDEWLDAWGDVDWKRYKFIDAVQAKGDNARWHLGLVAQAVRDAFAARGLDAQAIGLLCYDEWDEQTEPVYETVEIPEVLDDGGNVLEPARTEQQDTGETRVTREAGDRWGLRYDECFALEAAYQRRRMDRIEAAIAALGQT